MMSVWFMAMSISQFRLSSIEDPWTVEYINLISISLFSFILGALIFDAFGRKYPFWEKIKLFQRSALNPQRLRILIYFLFLISCIALVMFYARAGNFPLLDPDPDAFRFAADEQVPGLINYLAQLARVIIPLCFFMFFYEGFSLKKHGDLVLICLIGTLSLIMFASRTQIFFIDLWVMALYLFMRRPTWKQAFKFYPFFLIISIVVLAAVPLIRQYKSYGEGYLTSVTGIDASGYNKFQDTLVPIYVGVAFNQQALLHAHEYYKTHELQHGKVFLDPFTNIFGKVVPFLNNHKSNYDLGEIFYSWWNTGTYLFPFVQDFGISAFYWVPFIIAGLLTFAWRFWETSPNFLSINLYAYAVFFIVMSVYLSFTVRAEMYLDLMLLFASYLFVSHDRK